MHSALEPHHSRALLQVRTHASVLARKIESAHPTLAVNLFESLVLAR